MENITLFHNPKCSNSRNTLALIQFLGFEPTIVDYLKTPPSAEVLRDLLQNMNLSAGALIRDKDAQKLGLEWKNLDEEAQIALMLAHPILINRPIVQTPLGVRLCRPPEVFLEISPRPLECDFVKENGERIAPHTKAHS